MGRKHKKEEKERIILRPCPFCGHEAEEFHSLQNVPLSLPSGYGCKSCGVQRETAEQWNQRAKWAEMCAFMYRLGWSDAQEKLNDSH